MRHLLILIFLPFLGWAQPSFQLEITPVEFDNFPALHSFVHGTDSQNNWVLIGGRTDGLHKRRPFEAFDPEFNNLSIYKVDMDSKTIWEAGIQGLEPALVDQLQSSNMEYHQIGQRLILMGGYGYSQISQAFVTYPSFIIVDLELLSDAIENGQPIAPAFEQVDDNRAAVTGGQLQYIEDKFYLVGGHRFDGAYNPHGPDHGPGFSQEYTNEIRIFELDFDANPTAIVNYEAIFDETNLHRRDFNLMPQIFENEELGLTAFSGVFQHNVDLPFLNIVDIKGDQYTVNNDFSQLLNQYHTARISLYSQTQQKNTSVFFGGIGQYYFDAQGQLVNDTDVPFVKTVSVVERNANGELNEYRMPFEMPGYLGAAAEFINNNDATYFENIIFDQDAMGENNKFLLGYIIGGIESTQPNVLFQNEELSHASDQVFAVYYTGGTSSIEDVTPTSVNNPLALAVKPNPAENILTADFTTAESGMVWFMLQDSSGKVVKTWHAEMPSKGTYETSFEVSDFAGGSYYFSLSSGKFMRTVPVIIR
jgi:hypothetical protein